MTPAESSVIVPLTFCAPDATAVSTLSTYKLALAFRLMLLPLVSASIATLRTHMGPPASIEMAPVLALADFT